MMDMHKYFTVLIYVVCSACLSSNNAYAQSKTITPVVSLSQDRTNSRPLYNQVIEGRVFISISTLATNIERVVFWLDDPQGVRKPLNIDRWPPFDFISRNHKSHNKKPTVFDTTKHSNGEHSILIKFVLVDGSNVKMLVPFTIFNKGNVPFSEQYRR